MDFELHQAEIVLRSTLDTLAQQTEQTADSHRRVFDKTNQLAQALWTALRFGEATLLRQLVTEMAESRSNSHDREIQPAEDAPGDIAPYVTRMRAAIDQLTKDASSRIIQHYLDVLYVDDRSLT
jgi:hypothetical protein